MRKMLPRLVAVGMMLVLTGAPLYAARAATAALCDKHAGAMQGAAAAPRSSAHAHHDAQPGPIPSDTAADPTGAAPDSMFLCCLAHLGGVLPALAGVTAAACHAAPEPSARGELVAASVSGADPPPRLRP